VLLLIGPESMPVLLQKVINYRNISTIGPLLSLLLNYLLYIRYVIMGSHIGSVDHLFILMFSATQFLILSNPVLVSCHDS
jgi:hypothetical protein